MLVAGEPVGGLEGSYFADLFDDGEPKAVVTRMLFSLIKAGEYAAGVQRDGRAGIADAEAAGFQRDIDRSARDIMVAGIAEQIVEQDIDELRACLECGR